MFQALAHIFNTSHLINSNHVPPFGVKGRGRCQSSRKSLLRVEDPQEKHLRVFQGWWHTHVLSQHPRSLPTGFWGARSASPPSHFPLSFGERCCWKNTFLSLLHSQLSSPSPSHHPLPSHLFPLPTTLEIQDKNSQLQ